MHVILLKHLLKFGAARSAVAAVEFALVLPLLLTLYLGSLELSQLITVDRRVQTVTGTVGDLVSQRKDTISCSQLSDYFRAAQAIMADVPTTALMQTVTEIFVSTAGAATVKWSTAGPNGGTLQTVNGSYALDAGMAAISGGSYVIVSESWYAYTPLLGLFFKTAIPLYRKNFFVTRYASKIDYVAC
jgi:Flp pilus assembly protein TadG